MKSLKNINFEHSGDLFSILRSDISKLLYKHQQDMVDAMKSADKIATIHLYPLRCGRKHKSLLEKNESMYQQIYLCIYNNELCYALGHGRSSGMRENHNFFLNSFLDDEKLREKTISSVVVSYKCEVLAEYTFKGYSYCNHDIGTNWGHEIIEKAEKSNLPFSELDHERTFDEYKIILKTPEKLIEVYKSLQINEMLKAKLMRKKQEIKE